jgi:hypothetical protein
MIKSLSFPIVEKGSEFQHVSTAGWGAESETTLGMQGTSYSGVLVWGSLRAMQTLP